VRALPILPRLGLGEEVVVQSLRALGPLVRTEGVEAEDVTPYQTSEKEEAIISKALPRSRRNRREVKLTSREE
jgi:hypothetical protein